MKILFDVCCTNEFFDEYPQTAMIEFTKKYTQRILFLMDKVKELGVFKISEWDSLEWLDNDPLEDNEEPKEWNGRSEIDMINIYDSIVSWSAYVKNTNIELSCTSIFKEQLKEMIKYVDKDVFIHVDNLKEVIRVYNTPERDLPLLMGSLKSEDAKRVLTKRFNLQE